MVYDMLIEQAFLSTPSGWRATIGSKMYTDGLAISIHALRVEGDVCALIAQSSRIADFYPRPPGGGRLV